MFHTIYYENALANHPFVSAMRTKYPHLPHISCSRYTEIFNRKGQNFRLQKESPAIILAEKQGNRVLKTPEGYGIGGEHNYYFSHMLNCIYDCRYCFLQGMYRSGHYVVFVNHQAFTEDLKTTLEQYPGEDVYFFSGYDCDSLALENVTGFIEQFLPFFRSHPRAFLELRTKSINVNFLLKTVPFPNCIVAYSLTPPAISSALEHRTPSIKRRLHALKKLQDHGWPIGLRFDPVIYCHNYQTHYTELFNEVFSTLDGSKIHSVSLGPFRMPRNLFKTVQELYPEEPLFSCHLKARGKSVSYEKELEEEMVAFCRERLRNEISETCFFPCEVLDGA